MPLTLIADWLYPADPPPMKRLSEINQLHHGWPVTRPQFIGFTDFSFKERILFAPTEALVVMNCWQANNKSFFVLLMSRWARWTSNIYVASEARRVLEAVKCNVSEESFVGVSSADKVTYRANNTSKLFQPHQPLLVCLDKFHSHPRKSS